MKNKTTTIIGVIILLILILLLVRFFIGGAEDNWICENGEWTEHGVPDAPMPTEPCVTEQ